ncbi:MAG TPA: Spy/CpxP family protein refolding chaperone [Azospirillum sp.]|nr:Spy/CpxP family protein refolding chaperone [Azospirillum sp.]
MGQHGMMGHGHMGQGMAGQGMMGEGMGMMSPQHHNPMMQAMMQGMMLGMMGGAMMHGMMHPGMMHPGMMQGAMMGNGGPMMGGGMMGGPMMGEASADPEPRIAQMKAAMRITDAQMPLWNGFAEAVRESAKALAPAYEAQRAGAQQAAWPERMERREKLLAARLEALKRIRTAGNALYGVLSDEQRRTFDRMAGGPMGPFGGMGGMAGGPMNMGMGGMGGMMGGTPSQ